MNSSHYVGGKIGFNKLPALFCYSKLWAEHGLSCGCAEGHNHLRFDNRDLGLEPGTASGNFLCVRFFVNATFATRLPFKMFDNISDVSLGAIDTSFGERIVE